MTKSVSETHPTLTKEEKMMSEDQLRGFVTLFQPVVSDIPPENLPEFMLSGLWRSAIDERLYAREP